MKIALVQIESIVENPEEYEKTIMDFIDKAIVSNVELICFPEMAMCGYSLENLSEREILQKPFLNRLEHVAREKSITISIGGIERSKSDDKKFYITQYVISDKIEGYRKTHLGQREKTFFTPGNSIPVFKLKDVTFGIMTCYDGHFPELCSKMALQGAQFILNPSASPSETWKRIKFWERYLIARAYDNRVWVMGLNLCFGSKGGGILVYDGNGDEIIRHENSDNTMVLIDFKHKEYNTNRMCNRDFKTDRREDLYG